MSTHIIDDIAAVKIPKERSGYLEDYYIVAMEGGDNNCFDSRTNRRSRHWNLYAAGLHYQCLGHACGGAADCCGGMIKIHGRHTEPESYIRAIRKALEAAPDYQSPEARFRLHGAAITFTAEEREDKTWKWDYQRLSEGNRSEPARKPERREKVHLRSDVDAFPFDISNPREAAAFVCALPYKSPLWHHLTLTPRTL